MRVFIKIYVNGREAVLKKNLEVRATESIFWYRLYLRGNRYFCKLFLELFKRIKIHANGGNHSPGIDFF